MSLTSSSNSSQWENALLEQFSQPSSSYSKSKTVSKSARKSAGGNGCGLVKCQDQEIRLPAFNVCLDEYYLPNKHVEYRQPSICVQPKPVEVCPKPFWVRIQPKSFWVKVAPKKVKACSEPINVDFDKVKIPVPDTKVPARRIRVTPPAADLHIQYEGRKTECVRPDRC